MLWLCENNILTRNAIMVNNTMLNELNNKIYDNKICKQIILDTHKTIKEQAKTKINLYSFFDSFDSDLMLINDLFIHTAPHVFQKIMENKFEDFYLFMTQILKNVTIQQIEYYEIENLIYLKNLCKKIDYEENYTDILENIDSATKNSKILSLAYKICSK